MSLFLWQGQNLCLHCLFVWHLKERRKCQRLMENWGNHFCKYKFKYIKSRKIKRFLFLPVAGAFGSGDQLRCPEDPLPSGTPAGPPRSVWFSSLRAPSPHKPFTWRVSAVLMTELIRSCCKMKIQTSQLEGASQRSEKNGPNSKGSYKPASRIAFQICSEFSWSKSMVLIRKK